MSSFRLRSKEKKENYKPYKQGKMNDQTRSMLVKLILSKNEFVSLMALKLLANETTVEHELRFSGGFMTAVLRGDYETALLRADKDNREALTRTI